MSLLILPKTSKTWRNCLLKQKVDISPKSEGYDQIAEDVKFMWLVDCKVVHLAAMYSIKCMAYLIDNYEGQLDNQENYSECAPLHIAAMQFGQFGAVATRYVHT